MLSKLRNGVGHSAATALFFTSFTCNLSPSILTLLLRALASKFKSMVKAILSSF
jgi:hypothetical protein